MPEPKPIDTLTEKLKRQKRHYRRKRAIAAQFDEAGHHEIAQKLRNCREIQHLACCSACGASWYVTYKCHLRVCPLCSFEESRERTRFILAMTKHMKHPKLLTLTIPRSTLPPKEDIRKIRAAWSKLRRSKALDKVRGGCYQIEVKPKDNGFHIHIHAILDAPYLPRQHIWSAWKALTNTNCPQVDIRTADSDSAKAYVCKYAAKSADYESMKNDVIRWYFATKGIRLFSTFGLWFNATLHSLDPEQCTLPGPPPCPGCGETGTMFYARDGPFMFGKDWPGMMRFYLPEDGMMRRIHEVDEVLNAPDQPDPSTQTPPQDQNSQTPPCAA